MPDLPIILAKEYQRGFRIGFLFGGLATITIILAVTACIEAFAG